MGKKTPKKKVQKSEKSKKEDVGEEKSNKKTTQVRQVFSGNVIGESVFHFQKQAATEPCFHALNAGKVYSTRL